jgi:hypothetical protein
MIISGERPSGKQDIIALRIMETNEMEMLET